MRLFRTGIPFPLRFLKAFAFLQTVFYLFYLRSCSLVTKSSQFLQLIKSSLVFSQSNSNIKFSIKMNFTQRRFENFLQKNIFFNDKFLFRSFDFFILRIKMTIVPWIPRQ